MSTRIQQLIDSVHPCDRVIDVGCDHGQVSIGLAKRPDIGAILATDISGPSLQKLVDRLKENQDEAWAGKIETVHTDGLENLPWSTTGAILMAGMGGELMIKILDRNPDLVQSSQQLILSPHLDASKVRGYLHEIGFGIAEEYLLEEDGHYYEIISARKLDEGESLGELTGVEREYGPLLLADRNPLVKKKIEEDNHRLEAVVSNLEKLDASPQVEERLAVLKKEKQEIEMLLAHWEGERNED